MAARSKSLQQKTEQVFSPHWRMVDAVDRIDLTADGLPARSPRFARGAAAVSLCREAGARAWPRERAARVAGAPPAPPEVV